MAGLSPGPLFDIGFQAAMKQFQWRPIEEAFQIPEIMSGDISILACSSLLGTRFCQVVYYDAEALEKNQPPWTTMEGDLAYATAFFSHFMIIPPIDKPA